MVDYNERNVLYIGPPGVGKTYQTRKFVINAILNNIVSRTYLESHFEGEIDNISFDELLNTYVEGAIEIVQVSPNLNYDDFVEGVEALTENGNIKYEVKSKIALNIINIANQYTDYPCFLIIEDIHNTNMRAMFGELFYAIDNRDEQVTLASGTVVNIPKNLFILGTANSMPYAMSIDYSILRRFQINRLYSDEKSINYAEDENGNPYSIESLSQIDLLNQAQANQKLALDLYNIINKRILAKHNYMYEFMEYVDSYRVGQGYFIIHADEKKSESEKKTSLCYQTWHQVIPLLRQYQSDGIIKTSESINGEIEAIDVLTGHQKYYVVNDTEQQSYREMPHGLDIQYHDIDRSSKGFRADQYDIAQRIIQRKIIKKIVENPFVDFQSIWERVLYSADVTNFPIQVNGGIKQMSEPTMRIDAYEHLFSRGSVEKNIQYGAAEARKDATIPYSKREDKLTVNGQICYMLTRIQTYIEMTNQETLKQNAVAFGFSGVKKGVILFDIIYKIIWEYIKIYRELLIDSGFADNEFCNALVNNFCNSFNVFYNQVLDCCTDKTWGAINGNATYKQTCEDALNQFINDCWILGKTPGEVVQYTDSQGEQVEVIIKGVYKLMETNYQAIMDISGIHQMILQGPPGTSKTYGAKEFLMQQAGIESLEELNDYILTTKNDEYVWPPANDGRLYWDIVQFHPSYSYEDFVRGITVSTNTNSEISGNVYSLDHSKNNLEKIQGVVLNQSGAITYKTVNRTLGKMARLAKMEYEDALSNQREPKKFYIVVDEINRANLAIVFGELIYALEYRKTPVATPYHVEGEDYKIELPDNLYLIGTMNTADKSIGNIDYALRRRFLFFSLLPNKKVVADNAGNDESSCEVVLFDLIDRLFDNNISDEFHKEDVQIGHTYFIRKDLSGTRNPLTGQEDPNGSILSDEQKSILYKTQMRTRFIYQVIPILAEYYKDGVLKKNVTNNDAIVEYIISWAKNENIDDTEYQFESDDLKNIGYWNANKTADENTNDNNILIEMWMNNKLSFADDIRYCQLVKLMNS